MADIIGKGWAYPFQFGAKGGVLTTADQADGSTSLEGQLEHLRMDMAQILMTALGERLMRPTFGSRVHDLVFEPNDESLTAQVMYFCTDAVRNWDGRITPIAVESFQIREKLDIIVTYRVNTTRQLGSFVVPFGG